MSKWPAIYQIAAALGAGLAGFVIYVLGLRKAPSPPEEMSGGLALFESRFRLDFEKIMAANRESFFVEMDRRATEFRGHFASLNERLARVEITVAVLEERSGHGEHPQRRPNQ